MTKFGLAIPPPRQNNRLKSISYFELGRTLIEVLGVLAIIGLLSITGIKLYEYAMNKNFSNDIIQSAYKRAATREEKTKSGRLRKSFVANMYEGEEKTTYSFGITVPKTACDFEVIPVGLINKDDPTERAITPSLCKMLVNEIAHEEAFLTVFNQGCQEITAATASSLCEGAYMLQIALNPAVEPIPEPVPEPIPAPAPESEDLCVDQTVPQNCECNSATGQVTCCNGTYDGYCCNQTNGKLTSNPNNCPCKEGQPSCPVSNTCTEGTSVKADSATSMNFNPACPKNHYIQMTSDTEGCCKPCPDKKVTYGSNAIGSDQCVTETQENECPKKGFNTLYYVEDKEGNCYPCEWPRYLKPKDAGRDHPKCVANDRDLRILDKEGYSVLACKSGEGYLRDKNGVCHPCNTHTQVNVEGVEENCSVCDGSNSTTRHFRSLSSYISDKGVSTTYANHAKRPTDSGSFCNYDCPKNYFLADNFQCVQCSEPTPTGLVRDYNQINCSVCSNREWSGDGGSPTGYCAIKCGAGQLMDKDGKCWDCDDPKQSITLGNSAISRCLEVCPDSRHPLGIYCVKNCSEPTPLQNYYGNCYSCDSNDWLSAFLDRDTDLPCESICPDRVKIWGYCMPKCPSSKPLLDSRFSSSSDPLDTYCHSCDEDDPISIGSQEENCEKICPNRKLIKVQSRSYCVKECPGEKPLRGVDGKCYACNDPIIGINLGIYEATGLSYLHKEYCNKCSNRTFIEGSGRDYDLCVLPCPQDTNPLMLRQSSSSNTHVTDYSTFCTRCDDSAERLQVLTTADCETFCDGRDNEIHKKRSISGTYCLACPPDKPLMGGVFGGECHACNESAPIRCGTKHKNCHDLQQCDGTNDTTRAKRIFGDDMRDAAEQYWSSEYSYSCLGRPLDVFGHCQSCDYPAAIEDTDERSLNLCPNQRYINGNYSYSCKTGRKRDKDFLDKNYLQCRQCGGQHDAMNQKCIFPD